MMWEQVGTLFFFFDDIPSWETMQFGQSVHFQLFKHHQIIMYSENFVLSFIPLKAALAILEI